MDLSKLNVNINDDNIDKINKYIDEIKKQFPDCDVNLYNVNDFQLVLQEEANCKKCLGLYQCKNSTKGLRCALVDGNFSAVECKYKKDLNNKLNHNDLIKTFYMPSSIKEYTFENYDLNCESREKIFKRSLEFIANFGKENSKGLYLYGSNSKGKTYTLGCIANELAKANIKSLLIYFPDLVSDLKQSLNDNRFSDIINMLKEIDVLMLDDLGAENMTPWLRDEILGPILNYRVLEHKPIFISSNIPPNDLRSHLQIDKMKSSEVKANRILSRLTSLTSSINMDDSNKYDR